MQFFAIFFTYVKQCQQEEEIKKEISDLWIFFYDKYMHIKSNLLFSI